MYVYISDFSNHNVTLFKNSYAFRLEHLIIICTCLYKSVRQTPVTPELRPGGDSVVSLNNVKR